MVETETGWRIDLDRLRALVTPKTNLLVINFPHNPTGALPTPAEMDAIVELCESRGVWLFSDEMYRGLEHDPERRLAPAVTRSARALSLWGLSKSFGLPGLRIGWLAVRDKRVLAEMQKLKDYTTICSSGPSERLARVALDAHELLMRRNLAIIKDNLVHARDFVDRWPELLAWREPAAGPIAFLRLLRGGAHQFCDHAAERAGVMIVPSTVFDFGDAHIRIGLGRKHFPLALSALEGYLPRD
jgi:aspartate/methionine/tyrosine aminotransferase